MKMDPVQGTVPPGGACPVGSELVLETGGTDAALVLVP